ncbi:Ubiquitin carboxyl-terminal hydrolase 8 [Apostasia shenzhenica]|uniref:Ubiquitin carboxyl-terminal hydrolase n=1 Tax=Apostasia shenzhenica TaxID=1088818 RepID=A0A2I0A9T7_9ASPA|nr:Ubiquitin carboxyl-terminal hydrolase 8 [Apostasia shenzhenica]
MTTLETRKSEQRMQISPKSELLSCSPKAALSANPISPLRYFIFRSPFSLRLPSPLTPSLPSPLLGASIPSYPLLTPCFLPSMDDLPPDDAGNADQEAPAPVSDDDRVYLVPYRWWREAHEAESESGSGNVTRGIPYTASPSPSSYGGPMRIINNIFNSDLAFNLRRVDDPTIEDTEEGVSGRGYALVPVDMWSQALRWHNDASTRKLECADDGSLEVYPLKLRISVIRETSIMTVRISKKYEYLRKQFAKNMYIFSCCDQVYISDFSGQTNLILMNEWNRVPRDGQRLSDQEVMGESFIWDTTEGKKVGLVMQQPNTCYGGSFMNNGSLTKDFDLHFGASKVYSSFGLIGLENLGNTCFMNSAVQCLAHTQRLGELALAFGELLRKLWALDKTPVVPRVFKAKLAHFAPQFSGFNQHDSQELLAFLLDGLHEDLNRVKCKPYVEVKDSDGHPDEEVANEYWANHLARNDSIIVDVCQGQYRSTLVCPVCNKVSITFDPFMYLSLPLPSSTTRPMTVTVLSTDGSAQPSSYTVNVPKDGRCKDLIHSLSNACSLRNDEYLLVTEVYTNRIIRYLEDQSDALTLVRDGDQLAAYRLLRDDEEFPFVVFTHQREQEHYINSVLPPMWKVFGVPLIGRLVGTPTGYAIRNLFLKLLSPFLPSSDFVPNVDQENGSKLLNEVIDLENHDYSGGIDRIDAEEGGQNVSAIEDGFQFYLTDNKSQKMLMKIEINDQVAQTGKNLYVLVSWQKKNLHGYDISLLSSLPEICKCSLLTWRPQEPVALYACLETFLKEEPLGPEDMWYCPSCKRHQQASKKLDLWRLPDVLVIHLKRFSYNRYMKNKLEALVNFPLHGLDLSNYIAFKAQQLNHRYDLYAISNHYGNMGGGHYTAYVYHEAEDRWYEFDDRHVYPVSEDNVRTSAAYVLFYKRIQTSCSETKPAP